jgi:hypothetical protein
MNNDGKQNSIKDSILDKIKSGKLKMKPKVYFVLKNIAFVGLIVVLSAIVVYLVSFIVFALDINGAWLLTSFGVEGVISLILSLPWLLILIVLLSMVLIETCIRSFKFSYHRPLIYSVLGIFVLAIALGFCLHLTPLHSALCSCTEDEETKSVICPLYENYKMMNFPNFEKGIIIESGENEIEVQEQNGETIKLDVGNNDFERGDAILIKDNTNLKKFKTDSDFNRGCGPK